MLYDSSHQTVRITTRMLRDFAHCSRFCYLNWLQGEYSDADGLNSDREGAESPDAASDFGSALRQSPDTEIPGELAGVQQMITIADMPPPLQNSPKCASCSLIGICLPDEFPLPTDDTPASVPGELRQVVTQHTDALPMYVLTQGAVVSASGERLTVNFKGEAIASARLLDISSLSVFGGVQITTQAISALLQRDIPLCHFTHGGWLKGITAGLASKNVELRIAQFRTAEDPCASLSIARDIVVGKLRNSRVMFRRNHIGKHEQQLNEIARLTNAAKLADSFGALLGIEGAAARVYFSNFNGMLKTTDRTFDFRSRNRRPPRDPVNAVLSFLYAMLTKQVMFTTAIAGFDPFLGFYHRPKYGRPALALDLAEEFRPIIADSVALKLINNGELKAGDFIQADEAVALTNEGRKRVISAFEQRMETTIIHPLLGESISYRRILEVQARLLSGHLLGELSSYPAFTVR